MTVVFLDIDGVLCTERSCEAWRQRGLMQVLDPVGVGLLNFLLKDSGAKLVLSSTWRLAHDQGSMTAILQNAGLIDIPWHQNWKTPDRGASRGQEIEFWMEQHGRPDVYLILDDDRDMLDHQLPFFVRTNMQDGISYRDFLMAKKILGVEGK